ncbi:PREDICTED: uncharacterized protein LOC105546652 [Mandrillus leucophaeus]|uniref:uncharacterized protein LOC105546652 n=1 Tax=Mandrillus leucophaeus TaxID=9568 RepID=UPI0005F46B0A|nr:PREDICTED: uncharacterized protein LOC105546652 [Mandrillus leucophaeus]
MGTRLLCWVALCLLGAELTEAGVVQSPRYKVIEKSQAVTFWCNPVSGHATLYWYRQILGQGLELLVQFRNNDVVDDSQLPKDRFSAERLKGVNSTLKIQPAELGDSAVYLCASSLDTAVQRHFPPVHETAGLSPLYQLTAAFPYSSSSQGRSEQTFVQELELLSYFWSRSIIDDAGMPMDRLSAERPDGPFSTRKIQPTEQGDSAVCVCASRLAIALQNLPRPVQKFWCFPLFPTAPSNPGQSFLRHPPHKNN